MLNIVVNGTRPDTRPPVADWWAGAEMRVSTLFDSIITGKASYRVACPQLKISYRCVRREILSSIHGREAVKSVVENINVVVDTIVIPTSPFVDVEIRHCEFIAIVDAPLGQPLPKQPAEKAQTAEIGGRQRRIEAIEGVFGCLLVRMQ